MNFTDGYNSFIQNFFSNGIARIAVPIFFSISGYLFFLKFSGTANEFVSKYKKRAKSLLLPYLLWSIWGIIFFFVLQILPQSKKFFINDLIINYSFVKILDTLFINPIPYQLWFLRDLIILVILSPLIYWMTKHFKILTILLFFFIWVVCSKFCLIIVRSESIFFFCVGAYFSILQSGSILKKLSSKYYLAFTTIWIILTLIKTELEYQNSGQTILLLLLYRISILIGLVAIWSLYDILMSNKTNSNKILIKLSFFSFFLYAFHEPILTMVKKSLFYIIGGSDITAITIYFLAPIITIFLSISFGSIIKTTIPGFYKLITGGR